MEKIANPQQIVRYLKQQSEDSGPGWLCFEITPDKKSLGGDMILNIGGFFKGSAHLIQCTLSRSVLSCMQTCRQPPDNVGVSCKFPEAILSIIYA